MNNERYQEIIDDAYKNYINSLFYDFSGEVKGYVMHEHLTKEEFINKIKTDKDFTERWGVQVEERILSLEERYDLVEIDKHIQFMTWQSVGDERMEEILNEKNTPTKLITITYNNQSIEVYE